LSIERAAPISNGHLVDFSNVCSSSGVGLDAASVPGAQAYWFNTPYWIHAMQITVEKLIQAPVAEVWRAYTTPEDIKQWNAASDDWHTTQSTVDLRVGGVFTSRMEAKDGSFGFDFAGTYTQIVPNERIEYLFGDRTGGVEFRALADGVLVSVTFDAELENPVEQQRQGWQAILDNFAKHVEAQQPSKR
jgi:uncharacterized protein YndB with AHSA1/START domain